MLWKPLVDDVVMLIDPWKDVNDIFMEPLLCWWNPLVDVHGHGSIHRDSPICTLGILSLREDQKEDENPLARWCIAKGTKTRIMYKSMGRH